MTVVLGCLLGAGLVLMASPLLWPRRSSRERAARRGGAGVAVRSRLDRAGLGGVPVAVFVAGSAVTGVIVAALAQAIIGVGALTIGLGATGLVLPWFAVGWRANARARANRAIWPDAVDQLISAVRSGLALPDGVSALATLGPEATRPAFAVFERDYRATGAFVPCVYRLKQRLADPVADRILETVKMAREVGGTDLNLVLKALASGLREDAAIRSEVEARQSWVVNAARLGVAAPWIVLMLLSSRPEAALAYNTPTGTAVIACGLVVSVIAYRLMVALGRLPREKRWFA
jgi:hypothetical protein